MALRLGEGVGMRTRYGAAAALATSLTLATGLTTGLVTGLAAAPASSAPRSASEHSEEMLRWAHRDVHPGLQRRPLRVGDGLVG